ncbi:hypothetical protein RchiOBHm_Chr6g0260211 [Rosa chinensis]|uniref:Uncharacterized protein n=1 Tax=Rosa chinensis TaxID=74649 RepID=A0A2P6PN27_ROSCH|nr:hypothetical protein RchiOBHm_Chr6g0260211 [Rosa chinensis]
MRILEQIKVLKIGLGCRVGARCHHPVPILLGAGQKVGRLGGAGQVVIVYLYAQINYALLWNYICSVLVNVIAYIYIYIYIYPCKNKICNFFLFLRTNYFIVVEHFIHISSIFHYF